MKRRPVCLVCLLLMLCIWLMDLAGFARISGNPLPESVQLYIEKHPEAVICGEVQQYQATEYSLSAYLKHVCLIVGSEQIPIKNGSITNFVGFPIPLVALSAHIE